MPDNSGVNILFIGDIVGRAGRQAVHTLLPELVAEYQIACVIANGENAAGGMGITPKIADEFLADGITVLTSGNHIWHQKEILPYLDRERRLLRPLNFPPGTPGAGSCVITLANGTKIAVVNVLGRVFMDTYGCPFRALDQELERFDRVAQIVLVDVHAEATSEKQALGWYLDGKVSAVVGTHTHVQTADERILPQGTAYITDVGMTGSRDSVIGVKTELVLQKFLTYLPVRFESSTTDPWLNGVVITIEAETGRALRIERIQRAVQHE